MIARYLAAPIETHLGRRAGGGVGGSAGSGGGREAGGAEEEEPARHYSFVRVRRQGGEGERGLAAYGLTTVRHDTPSGERVERKRILMKREYEARRSALAVCPIRSGALHNDSH